MSIDIDFDVFQLLTALRTCEEETYSAVLRKYLPQPSNIPRKVISNSQQGWTVKGITFPINSIFRATYKGKTYRATVTEKGLLLDGKTYTSPSSAAGAITGNNVDGWRFWEYQLTAGNNWQKIGVLRQGV